MRTHLFRQVLVALTLALPLSAADEVYVDATGDFAITNDVAPAGLGAGDTVTWKPGLGGEVTGLTFGTDAFASIQDAVNAVTSGGTVFIAEGTHLEGARIDILKNVTLQGDGAALTMLSRGGAGQFIYIHTGATVTIANLAVIDGANVSGGSGIFNRGTLNLNYSTVSGNTARTADGGGIHNKGTLNVNHSTISGNTSLGGRGGGIYSSNSEAVTITNSTISGNSASAGGGVYIFRTPDLG